MRPIAFLSALLAALLLSSGSALAAGDWTWPVRGQVITQYRNGDDPYAAGQHRGIDIAAREGTEVVAATSGTIVYAGVVGSSGLTISQRTADGRHVLSYLHLASVSVRAGEAVAAGAGIGAAGSTGIRSAEQPHLHLGVREADDRHAYLDPLRFLAPPPADAPQPRPVPAPVPVAVPGLPAPALPEPLPAAAAPVPALAPAPLSAPAPALTGAPSARPEGASAHNPAEARHPAARTSGMPGPAAGRGHEPSALGVDGPARTPVGRDRPAGPIPLAGPSAPDGAARPAGPPARVPAAAPSAAGGGLDVGWLAACVGLVAAAALLARPREGGPARRPARTAFTALLRAGSR
jgi:hypothetical protein